MNIVEITLVALSLSMDCLAVSVSSGGTMKSLRVKDALKMAFFFGFFQSMMPVIGWLAGLSVVNYISKIDHWVAFGLLAAVGGKMVYESFEIEELNCDSNKACPFGTYTLVVLAFATSIDSLAVGITFSLVKMSIIMPVLVIGLVAFFVSLLGVRIGYAGRHFFENKMELAAGIILILLGLKILIQHLF